MKFTALFQKAGSFITGAGEACQFVPMVKGVDYNQASYQIQPETAEGREQTYARVLQEALLSLVGAS
jgi:hypothetical protein